MLSMILTINNRSPETSQLVAQSLRLSGNQPDELIVVLDRPTEIAKRGAFQAYTDFDFPVRFINVAGESGWKGPAKAWNHGFFAASGDLFYCISSEVVQDERNIEKAKTLAESGTLVVFGACHNSKKTEALVVGAEPGLLVSTKMPRPLGFIVCMPAKEVLSIGGFDETFMQGFWYDDDDFFLRLWQTGLDFVFDDSIHGIHLHHERPGLETPEGKAGIERNAAYMIEKHGTIHPWPNLIRREERKGQRLFWRHIGNS